MSNEVTYEKILEAQEELKKIKEDLHNEIVEWYQTDLKNEYFELAKRVNRLTSNLHADNIHTPYEIVPKELYERQLEVMEEYLDILTKRIELSGIEI